MLVFVQKVMNLLILEPQPFRIPHPDLASIWQFWIIFIILSCIFIVIEVSMIIITILHLRSSKRVKYHDTSNDPNFQVSKPLKIFVSIVHSLFLVIGIIMLIMSIVSIGKAVKSSPYCSSCNEDCDPLVPEHCILPYPSTYHLIADNTTKTGFRVNLKYHTLPKVKNGGHINPTYLNELDGFSTIGNLLIYLDDPDEKYFISPRNIENSIQKDSNSFIIDTETLERIPHFIELDHSEDIDKKLTIIQPAVPLNYSRRYIVGVRNIKNTKGEFIKPSEAFNVLLQPNKPSNNKKLAERWTYYNDMIFPILEYAEITNKSEFQLVWDFYTISKESSLSSAEEMRDLTLDFLTKFTPDFKIAYYQEEKCTNETLIGRTYFVDIDFPLYLEDTSKLSIIPRDNKGKKLKIKNTGFKRHNILIRIPCSLILDPQPATQIVQYGHGLFNTRGEVRANFLNKLANENKWILVASDWNGMSRYDLFDIANILLNELSDFIKIPESTIQGWANMAGTIKFMVNTLSKDKNFIINNVPVMNTTKYSFYGISQGAVIGGGYLTYSKDIHRGVLNVPGSPFTLLLSRSVSFPIFKSILSLNFYNWPDTRIALSLTQQMWDQGESAGWLSYDSSNNKEILLQAAIGDALVSSYAAEIMARSYNAKLIDGSFRPVFGVENTGTSEGIGYVEFYYNNTNKEEIRNIPPTGGKDPHMYLRAEPEIMKQTSLFLNTGQIKNFCKGKCIKEKSEVDARKEVLVPH